MVAPYFIRHVLMEQAISSAIDRWGTKGQKIAFNVGVGYALAPPSVRRVALRPVGSAMDYYEYRTGGSRYKPGTYQGRSYQGRSVPARATLRPVTSLRGAGPFAAIGVGLMIAGTAARFMPQNKFEAV